MIKVGSHYFESEEAYRDWLLECENVKLSEACLEAYSNKTMTKLSELEKYLSEEASTVLPHIGLCVMYTTNKANIRTKFALLSVCGR
jgi:hypothetical protein